jgi:hypothetical protein
LFITFLKLWLDKEKEEKESEEKERSAPRELPPRDTLELPLKALPSPLLEDSPEEEVSRESLHSSMMIPDKSLRDSSRVLLEMPSPTLSMPEEKPSPPWTSSMLLRDKEEPSMVSEVDLHNQLLFLLLFLPTKSPL